MQPINLTGRPGWQNLPGIPERALLRLLLIADARGRFDARIPILQGTLWPHGDYPNSETMQRILVLAVERQILRLYEVDGQPYGELVGGNCDRHSKYPNPPWEGEKLYEPNPDDPVVARLKLIREQQFVVCESHVQEWQKAYPAVDIPSHLQRMVLWCDTNVAHRKTARGINRFIHAWLGKEQDAAAGRSRRPYTDRSRAPLAAVYGND